MRLAPTLAVFRREFSGYFRTPLAAIFLVVFLVLAAAATFFLGGLFERNQADLEPFFGFHPWLFLFLIPAIGMRLWADERKTGTIEMLISLPLTTAEAVLGKFLAAWAFAALAILLTFPMWLTVSFLGAPDHGVILASYLGSIVMAGAFLAVTAALSAATSNQVIAFILGALVCFLLLMSGIDLVLGLFQGWAPPMLRDLIAALSALTHFETIRSGVIEARSLVYFIGLIALGLSLNVILVDLNRAK